MATIDQRIGSDGTMVYRVRVRPKGYATQTATFPKLTEAKKWAQVTEGPVLEGRHFQVSDAKKHTFTDFVTRYRREVLPHKRTATILDQVRQLRWWQPHLGYYLLPMFPQL
jgi:uncharacterized protein YeaO (DUF488 family)